MARQRGSAPGDGSTTASRADDPSVLVVEMARHVVAIADQTAPDSAETTEVIRPDAPWVRRDSRARVVAIQKRAQIEARTRAQRLPYLATAGTAAAGYAAWGLGEIAGAGAGPLGSLVATSSTAGLCAAALAILRVTYRDGIAAGWRRRWWATGAAAATWVTTASAIGAGTWPMTACLAVGAAAASARWMHEHQTPQPGSEPTPVVEPEPVELDEDLGELLARRWAQNVSRAGKAVPGALLTDRQDYPNAIRWTVQTPPGSVTFEELFARRGRIASGLRQPAVKVLLEPSDEDESYSHLTVITRDLLAAGIPYTGPRYENGRVKLGPFADGTGDSEYISYDRVGCRNGMATGEPGSGKSAFLEAVALGLKSSGEWVVWFGDGDPEGGSSPLLNEITDWPEAGPQRVLAQLEAIEAALIVRGMLKATLTAGPDGRPVPITDPTTQRPVRELRPSPDVPGIKWIVDELHRLTSDPWMVERGFVKRLERLVRIGRKYGIVLLTGSQSLLAPDYGNSTPLRGYLAARNLFAFRNGNKSEKAVVSGLDISPSVLPEGGGYAFAAGAGRLAMTRVAWSPDMADHAVGLPDTQLDQDTELAVASFRPAIPRDPSTAFAEQIKRLQEWRALQANPQAAGAQLPLPELPVSQAESMLSGGLAGLQVPTALTGANVIPMQPRRAQRTAQLRDTGPDLDVLPGPQLAVYEALREGMERTGEIAEATGLRLPAVSKALSALSDLGLARKQAHGRYAALVGTG